MLRRYCRFFKNSYWTYPTYRASTPPSDASWGDSLTKKVCLLLERYRLPRTIYSSWAPRSRKPYSGHRTQIENLYHNIWTTFVLGTLQCLYAVRIKLCVNCVTPHWASETDRREVIQSFEWIKNTRLENATWQNNPAPSLGTPQSERPVHPRHGRLRPTYGICTITEAKRQCRQTCRILFENVERSGMKNGQSTSRVFARRVGCFITKAIHIWKD